MYCWVICHCQQYESADCCTQMRLLRIFVAENNKSQWGLNVKCPDIFVKLNFPISISTLNPSSVKPLCYVRTDGRSWISRGCPDVLAALGVLAPRVAALSRRRWALDGSIQKIFTQNLRWCVCIRCIELRKSKLPRVHTHTTGNYLVVPVEFNGRTCVCACARVRVCVLKANVLKWADGWFYGHNYKRVII